MTSFQKKSWYQFFFFVFFFFLNLCPWSASDVCFSFTVFSRVWSTVTQLLSGLKVKVTQLCPALCNLMDYRVNGILQAEYWSGLPFISPGDLPQGQNWGLPHWRLILYQLSHREAPSWFASVINKITYSLLLNCPVGMIWPL